MTLGFYALLLLEFVVDFQNKKRFFVNLNYISIVLRQCLDKSICHTLKSIILYCFFSGRFHSTITQKLKGKNESESMCVFCLYCEWARVK